LLLLLFVLHWGHLALRSRRGRRLGGNERRRHQNHHGSILLSFVG
jgi:hypothetical protein